jgi:hypothetical protein
MSLEFEVRDADAVQSATEELRQQGFMLLHDRRDGAVSVVPLPRTNLLGPDSETLALRRG